MSTTKDRFTSLESPDRVYYAQGVFLDAEDLEAEQTYHRGRLARALLYLHGTGTAAGLEVEWHSDSDELRVHPGVAIDRLGRLIDLPKMACVNLGGWFTHHRAKLDHPDDFDDEADLTTSLSDDSSELVADVFLRFAVCERGRTPAFATGPFDALDATSPHRLRDSYELSLVLRGGDDAGLPQDPWPQQGELEDFASFRQRMQQSVLDAWRHGSQHFDERDELLPDASTDGVGDPSSVFLARIRIPVTIDGDTGLPDRAVGPVAVDNYSRAFIYPTAAQARWLQAVMATSRLS